MVSLKMGKSNCNRYGPPINVRDEDLRSDDASLTELINETRRLAKRNAAPTISDLRKAESRIARLLFAQKLYRNGKGPLVRERRKS
jgi:hypothetical protein